MSDPLFSPGRTLVLEAEQLPPLLEPRARPEHSGPRVPRYPILTGAFRGLVLTVISVAVCAAWFLAGMAYQAATPPAPVVVDELP